jgi:hypothetical protein
MPSQKIELMCKKQCGYKTGEKTALTFVINSNNLWYFTT